MSKDAKAPAKAAPAKKVQQAPVRQEGPKQLGLRPWEPGSLTESPRADPRADGGRPLDPWVRSSMEARFGHDFGRIRIHTGPDAAERASTLGANAYTLGLDVYFGAGRYRPGHPVGQKLIAHELEHVVRAGAAGPAIPMLDPDPATIHEEKLRKIFESGKKAPSDLKKYVEAHPESFEIAEKLVAAKAASARWTVRLLGVLIKKDPKSEDRVAKLLQENTADARKQATEKTLAMWKHYEEAAFADAMVQWATKKRDEEKKNRPKPPRPPKGEKAAKPEPTELELQYETWLKEAQTRFDDLAAQRKSLIGEANSALDSMMAAAEPLPYIQKDVLEILAEEIHGSIDEARRVRIRTFEDDQLVTHEKSPSVAKKLAAGEKKIEEARAAEERARQKREALEPPPPAAPASPEPGAAPAPPPKETRAEAARRKSAEKALAAARKAEGKAVAAREKAEKAITLEGVRDPELRYFLESQDPTIRGAAEADLKEARVVREAKLNGKLPTEAREPFELDALLDDKQRWWIYHTALANIGSGFSGFSYEHSILKLVVHRSAVLENRKALGVPYDVSIGTYHGHGEGQYDIHAPSGESIHAAQPEIADLTRALGKRAGSDERRLFQRVETRMRSYTKIDAEDGDEDVLAKLSYGYFGRSRSWKGRDKMSTYLAADSEERKKLGTRNPDATRVIAALTFDNSISGSPISSGVQASRQAIRKKLDAALHAELRKLTPPVEIPDTAEILKTVDASKNSFGGISMITKDAYDVFLAIPGKGMRKGKPIPAYTKHEAALAVFKAANALLKTDPTITGPVETLISDLLAKGRGSRSGPYVTLIHHYREASSGEEAWVEVDYRHLLAVETPDKSGVVEPGTLIGKVGSSGNAVSPHIHMAIRVYERDPQTNSKVVPIGYLVPLDFFPFSRPDAVAAKPAATPEASVPEAQP